MGLLQKMLIPIHFKHFSLIFIFLMAIFGFEKIVAFWRVEGVWKTVLHICENVDNFGWLLR